MNSRVPRYLVLLLALVITLASRRLRPRLSPPGVRQAIGSR